ncbi:hypothetical protein B5E87_04735 [Massilimicrobiota sp. An142]|nr:hypothetical protein B5E87_04735 [Massilimicrobiota sp. An142]
MLHFIKIQALVTKEVIFINNESQVILIIICLIFILSVFLAYKYNPFSYPYYKIEIDITGKKNVDIDEQIELYLLRNKENSLKEFETYLKNLNNWKQESEKKIENSILKKRRKAQYLKALDDKNMFCFYFIRRKTKYKQVNYMRYPYIEKIIYDSKNCDINAIREKYKKLENINFETTTKAYNMKNQRKLMTKKLRDKIKKRDNYTCQKCGKYMPDEVGLHIDHIIPVSKGGKSVESNLQVLCSKCNGKKTNKM